MHCGNREHKRYKHQFSPTALRAVMVAQSVGLKADYQDGQTYYRGRLAILARWYVWYGLRSLGMSLPQIGRATGGYDHTTVLHGLRKLAKRTEDDPKLKLKLDAYADHLSKTSRAFKNEWLNPKRKRKFNEDAVYAYWRSGHSLRATARQFSIAHETVRRLVRYREQLAREAVA